MAKFPLLKMWTIFFAGTFVPSSHQSQTRVMTNCHYKRSKNAFGKTEQNVCARSFSCIATSDLKSRFSIAKCSLFIKLQNSTVDEDS